MNLNFPLIVLVALPSLAAPLTAQDLTVFKTPDSAPTVQLTRYLNGIGLRQLQQRSQEIARITTKDEMERRKKAVREKMLRLLGGLPDYRGPLNVKEIRSYDRGDYRMENIVYESLPGFYVPANVYRPGKGTGPFPAILMPVGHSARGKDGERVTAISLARKGFVVLKFDPIGQGERLQYYDPEMKASKAGGPTSEHSHAHGHTMLVGENIARYRIWDGMRGIDYLVSRKDVDPNRIGCTGCSGGGTLTTYISALDDRVKAAAPACYITSWEELLNKLEPQDAEQNFTRFLAEGLNIADFVELFAPKPWLSLNTIEDFFPLEGARQTYMEARRIFALYGAEDRLGWFIGPGGHGVPPPSREAIYAWFIKWLKNGDGDPREAPVDLDPYENILCTKTGQVSDSLGGETVFSINRKRAAELMPSKQPVARIADLASLRKRLVAAIRDVAGVELQPGGPVPAVRIHDSVERDGYRADVVSLRPERGIRLAGVLLVPDAAGRKPAVLVADSRAKQVTAREGGELEVLVKAGHVVFVVQPRGVSEEASAQPRSGMGDQTTYALAEVVGKTVVGMRAEDLIRAVDYLASRDDVDAGRISGFGQGALGVPMLHAAVLDERISRLVLQETPALYRLFIDNPMYRDVYEVGITGVLRQYDLDDLLVALSPRPVMVLNPADALGDPLLRLNEFRELCRYAFEADEKLGQSKRIQVVQRGGRDALLQFVR